MMEPTAEDKAKLRDFAKEGAAKMLGIDLDHVEKEALEVPLEALQFMAFAAAENDANWEFLETFSETDSY